jgi:hypothetical protein
VNGLGGSEQFLGFLKPVSLRRESARWREGPEGRKEGGNSLGPAGFAVLRRRDSWDCGRLTAGGSIDLMNIEKTMEFIVSNLADLTLKQADLTVKQARTDRQIHGLQVLVKTGMRM